jgi:hypothetical protein
VTLTLEDLASADFIARNTASDPEGVARLRAILAGLTPETVVSDGCTFTGSMKLLAELHQKGNYSDEPPLTECQAWGFAVCDLVFHGFHVVDA